MRARFERSQQVWLTAAALAILLLCGCASNGLPLPEITPEINATLRTTPIVIAPGDRLSVKFAQHPDWNHETQVHADGTASFMMVDATKVAGLTLEQLDKRLTDLYAATLQQPDLTVFVTTYAARSVTVMGEVGRPGEILLDGRRVSFLEALGRVGGPRKDTAYLENVLLVRWLPEENQQVVWKIDASVEYWETPTPLLLQPYDIIYVPNKPVDRVNIFVDQYIRQMIPFPGLRPSQVVVQ